jgi:hypothetical protein
VKYWRLIYLADAGEVPNQYLLLLNMSIPKYDKEGNKVESLSEIREREFLARFGSRKKLKSGMPQPLGIDATL